MYTYIIPKTKWETKSEMPQYIIYYDHYLCVVKPFLLM